MDPIPLPDNPFPQGVYHDSYNRCLALQAEAEASRVKQIHGCPPPLVCARVVGHLLRLVPDPQGLVQQEVALAASVDELMRLAAHYVHTFIRTFKRSNGRTPAPSEHPSRQDGRESAIYYMEENSLDHRSARTWAMRRDNNRCMITGKLDFRHGGTLPVESAHIIPASVNGNISEANPQKRFNSAGVWAILAMFSQGKIIQDLAGKLTNRLENIISMHAGIHALFDELFIWLRPVENLPQTYDVCVAREDLRTDHFLPYQVTFSTNRGLPLPGRNYLALHALCCEVAWMSGAAEYVMDIERRMDDTKVLSEDGSSVDMLMVALSSVA